MTDGEGQRRNLRRLLLPGLQGMPPPLRVYTQFTVVVAAVLTIAMAPMILFLDVLPWLFGRSPDDTGQVAWGTAGLALTGLAVARLMCWADRRAWWLLTLLALTLLSLVQTTEVSTAGPLVTLVILALPDTRAYYRIGPSFAFTGDPPAAPSPDGGQRRRRLRVASAVAVVAVVVGGASLAVAVSRNDPRCTVAPAATGPAYHRVYPPACALDTVDSATWQVRETSGGGPLREADAYCTDESTSLDVLSYASQTYDSSDGFLSVHIIALPSEAAARALLRRGFEERRSCPTRTERYGAEHVVTQVLDSQEGDNYTARATTTDCQTFPCVVSHELERETRMGRYLVHTTFQVDNGPNLASRLTALAEALEANVRVTLADCQDPGCDPRIRP